MHDTFGCSCIQSVPFYAIYMLKGTLRNGEIPNSTVPGSIYPIHGVCFAVDGGVVTLLGLEREKTSSENDDFGLEREKTTSENGVLRLEREKNYQHK